MKFTKAELKVIHSNLRHNLAMLNAISILENDGKRANAEEAKIIKSILNKIYKEATKPKKAPKKFHDWD